MKISEIVTEAKLPPIRDQILADVRKHGGSPDEYFVRFTDMDKLGFSGRQWFGKTPDVDHPKFDVDYIGHSVGRRALWFYPLSTYLKSTHVYASEQPYVWLVKLKPDAWLQTVTRSDKKELQQPPQGKQRVGIMRMSDPPAAIFFTHGFDVVGKYYDYAKKHRRHGQVKGKPAVKQPESSFWDRLKWLFSQGK
jgi:hypothetical protein